MSDLDIFLHSYERATNTHDFEKVRPLIAENAVYWFSNGSFEGIEAIGKAFSDTWTKIQNEEYSIENIKWLTTTDCSGTCVYDFRWSGMVDGKTLSGYGRGTNIINKTDGKWQMLHEHLSKKP